MEKDRQKEIEDNRRKLAVAMHAVFSGRYGEEALEALKHVAYINRSFYRRGITDIDIAFCEGGRSVVLFILGLIKEAEDAKRTKPIEPRSESGEQQSGK